MPKQQAKRHRVTKKTGKQVVVWFDPDQIRVVDQVASREDLDRSQFIRRAVKNALAGLKA